MKSRAISLLFLHFHIILSALFVATSGSANCSLGQCIRVPENSLCKRCTYSQYSYCQDGNACILCGGGCVVAFTDPGLEDRYLAEADTSKEEFTSVVPPGYAHKVTDYALENCYVEEGSDEAWTEVTIYTWNGTEFLDAIDPFGLSVSTELLKQIEAYDPAAAWVIAERMQRGEGLMPTANAHIGSYEFSHAIEGLAGIDEADGDSTLMRTERVELPAGDSQTVSWSFDFSTETGNSLTVKSVTARQSQFDQLDTKTVQVYLSYHPVGEMVVVASDNYMAPVYEVESFAPRSH